MVQETRRSHYTPANSSEHAFSDDRHGHNGVIKGNCDAIKWPLVFPVPDQKADRLGHFGVREALLSDCGPNLVAQKCYKCQYAKHLDCKEAIFPEDGTI